MLTLESIDSRAAMVEARGATATFCPSLLSVNRNMRSLWLQSSASEKVCGKINGTHCVEWLIIAFLLLSFNRSALGALNER